MDNTHKYQVESYSHGHLTCVMGLCPLEQAIAVAYDALQDDPDWMYRGAEVMFIERIK